MATKQTSILSNRASQISAGTPSRVSNVGGRVRQISGTVALAVGDLDLNDIVMLAGVPTNAVVNSIKLASDDLDSGAAAIAWSLGLYSGAADTAETKDENVYATAITLGQAVTPFTEYAFEARGIELCGQKVWEDAGDTSDPVSEYFIGLVIDVIPATAAAGDLSFIIEYTVD
jgi:hypothetical protein